MDWRKRIEDQPYPVAGAICGFAAAGLMFASIATGSRSLFLAAGGFIVAALVASLLALYGPDGLYRR